MLEPTSLLVAATASLLGAIVGAGAVLIGQVLSNRTLVRLDEVAQRAERLRAVLDAVEAFVDAAQEVERVAGTPEAESERNNAAHRMWAAAKRLELIAPKALREPLDSFARASTHTLWHGPPAGKSAWDHLLPYSRRFQESARDCLGFALDD